MDWMQIFTLVTGVIYIVLEIRQKNFMWVVGIATSLAAMWVFFRQGLYASFGLNTYYLITAFIGLWQWGRDKKKLSAEDNGSAGDVIHLNRLSAKTVAVSALIAVAGTFALAWVMDYFARARYIKVTAWARLQGLLIPKVPSPMPLVTPFSTAQLMGASYHMPATTSVKSLVAVAAGWSR